MDDSLTPETPETPEISETSETSETSEISEISAELSAELAAFADLGLDDPHERGGHTTLVYLLAVRRPNLTRLHIIAAGVPADRVDDVIGELIDTGLLRPTGEDSWEAIPPDVALPALARDYETRASYLRDSAEQIGHLYHRMRLPSGDTPDGVTVLRNTDELTSAIQFVAGAATGGIWAAYDDSPRTALLFTGDLERHRERLVTRSGTPLKRWTTFDTRMLDHPRSGDVLLARVESGEQPRFLSGLPFSLLVADDTMAVVDLTSYDTSGSGSLLVQDRRIVAALRQLCETWWRLATPLAWESLGDLDRDSAFILSLLAAGATDAMMAEQLGLSQRTVERRVRALMTRLGAATRFQAGVLAVRRGWI